jgi:hypothetical protein
MCSSSSPCHGPPPVEKNVLLLLRFAAAVGVAVAG